MATAVRAGMLGPISAESRRRIAASARTEQALRSFAAFVKQAWHVIEGVPLEWTPFLQALCDHIQFILESWLVANRKANKRQRENVKRAWALMGVPFREGRLLVQNFIINAPPSSLKSRLLMVFGPAWMWLHDARWSVACTCANDEIVKRDSDAHRELVESPWYRETFGIRWKLDPKVDAVQKWANTAGGVRLSRTFLSTWIGVHVDAILVDDPDDAMTVFDEPQRLRVHNKWTRSLENRYNSALRSIRIVAQQRVHVDDLTAYLLALKSWSPRNLAGWFRLAIAMEFGMGPEDLPSSPLGWVDPRTERGELMHPERFPPDVLEDHRTSAGPHGFEAQYNQNPEPMTGGMFARDWFQFFRLEDMLADLPRPELTSKEPAYLLESNQHTGVLELDDLVITVDATFGSLDTKTASAVGMLVVGIREMRRFVFDDKTELMTFLDTVKAIKAIIRNPIAIADPTNRFRVHVRRVLIELKANGKAVVESLTKELGDGTVIGPEGDPVTVIVEGCETGKLGKVARANAMVPAIAAGMVFLLLGAPWLRAFLGEVCLFPKGRRDDRVDALSQLMAFFFVVDKLRAKRRAKW